MSQNFTFFWTKSETKFDHFFGQKICQNLPNISSFFIKYFLKKREEIMNKNAFCE